MRRVERLFQILRLVRARSPITARELAKVLEVSERTVQRDLQHLQAEGVAIDGVAGLGYVAGKALDLPPLNFTSAEWDTVALGLAYVRAVGDGELAAASRSAASKLGTARGSDAWDTNLSTASIGVLTRAAARAPKDLAALRRALRSGDACRIAYVALDGRHSRRLVRPLRLLAYAEGWLLEAWCENRDARRTFRVDRMREVQIVTCVQAAADGAHHS